MITCHWACSDGEEGRQGGKQRERARGWREREDKKEARGGKEGKRERGGGGTEEEEERDVPRFTACDGVVKRWTCAVAAL